MKRRRNCLLLAGALALAGAGCGTYNNVLGDNSHMVYGGVRRDNVILHECTGGSPRRGADDGDDGVLPIVNNMAAFTAFADMPLSFVGDTLTLPFTLCCAMVQSGEEEQPRRSTRSSAAGSRP